MKRIIKASSELSNIERVALELSKEGWYTEIDESDNCMYVDVDLVSHPGMENDLYDDLERIDVNNDITVDEVNKDFIVLTW